MSRKEEYKTSYYKNLCEELITRIELLEKMLKKKKAKAKERKLDPVGKEDADIDNDGKPNTKTDKYLRHRRDVRKQAINKKKNVIVEGCMITDGRLSYGGFPRINVNG